MSLNAQAGGATSCVSADGAGGVWASAGTAISDERQRTRRRTVTHREVLDASYRTFRIFGYRSAGGAVSVSFSSSLSRSMRRLASSRYSLCSNSLTSRS